MTHRALILSALAEGESLIKRPLKSDDTEATSRILRQLGVSVTEGVNSWQIEGGRLRPPLNDLYCGESGTTLRLMMAVCPLIKGKCRLSAGKSLSGRPLEPLLEALSRLGVTYESVGGRPPLTVHGTGTIRGGYTEIRGDISSQFVSALLIVSPLAERPVAIRVTTPLESKPYVAMTLEAMRIFGVEPDVSPDMRCFQTPMEPYAPTEVAIEGDWSSAAYLLASGVLGGEVSIRELNLESSQADMRIIDVLRRMGTDINYQGGDVTAKASILSAINYDLSDCPDLFPIVSALCAVAEGESRLTGLSRLRFKESDRIEAMAECLTTMGAEVDVRNGSASIKGGRLSGATVDPHGDHRIAMALAVLSLAAKGETTIMDAECVSKSYPSFWGDLESVGVKVRRMEG
jgi:3-phosphoshikimate 1-carboxyvinyltransferase